LTKPDPTAAAKTLTYNTNLDRVEAGFTVQGLAGESISQFQAVFYNAATNRWLRAVDASLGVRGIAATAAGSGATIYVYQEPLSIVTNTGWAWTAGQDIYISTTAGTLTATAPTTNSQPIGIAISPTEIMLYEGGGVGRNTKTLRLHVRYVSENTNISDPALIVETPDSIGAGQAVMVFKTQGVERGRIRSTGSGDLVLSGIGGDLFIDNDNPNANSNIRVMRSMLPQPTGTRDFGSSSLGWRSIFTRRDDGIQQHTLEAHSNIASNSPITQYLRARVGPAAILSGDRLVAWIATAYNGTAFASGGNNAFFATENWTTAANGSRFQINITRDGTTSVIVEAIGVRTPADGETALLIARNIGGTITVQRVSMGAIDSAGVGFRALRIPN
jgi:hypothetical protein